MRRDELAAAQRMVIPHPRSAPPGPSEELPPHNIQAEQSVLGSMLRDNGCIGDVARTVRPEDFFRDSHQLIYRAILAIHGQGSPLDCITLLEELGRRGEAGRVGGEAAIEEILRQTPSAANAGYHARIVHQKSIVRATLEIAHQAIKDARSGLYDCDQLIGHMNAELGRLQSRRGAAEGPAGPPAYATLADALVLIGDTRWIWERWIPAGCMSLLAAVGGGGKTRTAMDLARRLWFGLPFPDGSPNPYPPGTRTLWIMYDRNWAETAEVAKNFGVPLEALLLATSKDDPIGLPDFDDPRTMDALQLQVEAQQPALIFVDTITFATRRNTAKSEEAKAAFDGIMDLSARTGVAVLGLTHLNKENEVLNRRISDRARSVLMLSVPDPEGQPDRRKFWVKKTAVKPPEALGITFTDASNDYDDTPPSAPDEPHKKRGPDPAKSTKMAEWLFEQLSAGGKKVGALVNAARFDKFLATPQEGKPKPSISPLYAAKDRIPSLKPGWTVGEDRRDGSSFWYLVDASNDAGSDELPEDHSF